MNIIVGQNESLPNIEGSFEIGRVGDVSLSSEERGSFNSSDRGGSFSGTNNARAYYDGNRSRSVLRFSALDGEKSLLPNIHKVYKNNAEVKTKNFTYKIWLRKF